MIPLRWGPGDRCWLPGLGAAGVVLGVNGETVTVQTTTGSIFTVHIDRIELRPVAPERADEADP